MLDGKEGDNVQGVDIDCCTILRIRDLVPKQYFHLYLKEIGFRFNHRDEDTFRLLANIMVKNVPDS